MAPERKVALITGTNRLIEAQPSETRLTIIVTSRTLPRAREVIDSINEFVKKSERAGIVDFDYLLVDFTDMVSILSAAYDLNQRYKAIDYFFANSAQGVYDGIDWVGAAKELIRDPIAGATDPHYKIQRVGVKSKDGMGLVFQCNVFGPYYLIHKILPLLQKAKARIVWVSSIMSDSKYLSFDDLQLLKSDASYEGSKRSIDLLHIATFKKMRDLGITQYLIQPGSPWVNISGYTAANAPVYAATLANSNFERQDVKYGSACYRDGSEYIKIQDVDPTGAQDVLKYLDTLTKEWDEKLKDQITNSRQP